MASDDQTPTAQYLLEMGRHLDVVIDVDLGELIEGHHVVARGIEFGAAGDELHYEFVPGLSDAEMEARPFAWYWMVYATDDLGTEYTDYNGGAMASPGGAASHGTRDIGGVIPRNAASLVLRFEPPSHWMPPEPWTRALTVDLRRNH